MQILHRVIGRQSIWSLIWKLLLSFLILFFLFISISIGRWLYPDIVAAWKYHQLLTSKWIEYKNEQLGLSFIHPETWTVTEDNVTKGVGCPDIGVGTPGGSFDRLYICKNPPTDTLPSLQKDDRYVTKEIATPHKKYISFQTDIEHEQGLNITRNLVAEDKSISIGVYIPPLSDTAQFFDAERDKIFLKIVESINTY